MNKKYIHSQILWIATLGVPACNVVTPSSDETGTGGSTADGDALTTTDSEIVTSTLGAPETATSTATATASTTGGDTTTVGSSDGGEPPGDCPELRVAVEELLEARCAGCHSEGAPNPLDHITDLDRLVSEGRFVAGDPAGSQVYQRVASNEMPKGGPPLTDEEKQTMHGWIAECLEPLPDPCAGNPFITTDQMIQQMHAAVTDTEQVPVSAQPFIRFFTFTHLYNAGMCGEQIDVYRHALGKLLNSLSNNAQTELPHPIDPEGTIYRIDLRDYGWIAKELGQADVWELLVDRNPFAVEYVGDEAAQLKVLTGTKVPFQMGDWFITDAATAPLYDEILYGRVFAVVPDFTAMTRFDLEALLGVDVEAGIGGELLDDQDRVIRAGFQKSGVSEQNRVIERHQIVDEATRVYWISYDFLTNAGFGDIFTHPLDFVEAGGEVIWNLPNELQAYLLVDANGLRIDAADVDIVNNKEDNGSPIVNGVSCMGCHYQGMRPATDEVAQTVLDSDLFDELSKEQVTRLYAPADDFAAAVQTDLDTFVERVEHMGLPLLVDGQEPVSAVHAAFSDVPLDERRLAAELGVAELDTGKLPQGLQKIDDLPVDRDSVRADYAAAICNLKRGITKVCPN